MVFHRDFHHIYMTLFVDTLCNADFVQLQTIKLYTVLTLKDITILIMAGLPQLPVITLLIIPK